MSVFVESGHLAISVLLALSACVGALALISPPAFSALAQFGNQAILARSRRGERGSGGRIDSLVQGHERVFGVIVVATASYVGWLLRFGPVTYSKSFLLVIVAIALGMGILALFHIRRQSREIDARIAEAHTDALTGAVNRRLLETELDRCLAQRQRLGTPFCLLTVDIDKFKACNDRYGHALGDEVLKLVARLMHDTVRRVDIVARLGGDEFVVLLPDSSLEGACHIAESLRLVVGRHVIPHETDQISITISVGVTEAQADDDARSLLKRADSALYAAKEAGRNCCFRQGLPVPALDLARDELEAATPTAV